MGVHLWRIGRFLFHHSYITEEQFKGFGNYKYEGIDTNPFNNYISMPICEKIASLIPVWLAPNLLTFTTFLLSLIQYLLLARFDYNLNAMSDDRSAMDIIPREIWLYSGIALITAVTLDALDGKHARRIGACSPVGELFDHSVDTWRLTAPMITCFYSLFGRMEYGVPGYRLIRLLVATQTVVFSMFWHQHVTGVLVYSWGYDLMQYIAIAYYLFTYFTMEGAEWWQSDFYFWGTHAEVTEKFAYVLIFGISLPMQAYHSIKYQMKRRNEQNSFFDDPRPLLAPFVLFLLSLVLTLRNGPDYVVEQDPRAALWLIGIVFCDIMWQLLLSRMTKTKCPLWNPLLTMFLFCCLYWLLRPALLFSYDAFTIRLIALLATFLHLHRVILTLHQMCVHFGIYFFSVQPRKKGSLENGAVDGRVDWNYPISTFLHPVSVSQHQLSPQWTC